MTRITRTTAWLAALLGVMFFMFGTASPALADSGDAGDSTCTSGTFSGNTTNGSWTRTYNPGCAYNTVATITINWTNTTESNGHHHIHWDANLNVAQIYGNKCVEVALDWDNPLGGHSDVQFMRNCDENSNETMSSQNIDTNSYSASSTWIVQRLHVGTYDPSDDTVNNVACPSASGAPTLTNGDQECTDWLELHGDAAWGSKAAKIYHRLDSGVQENNLPTYPNNYDITNQTQLSS